MSEEEFSKLSIGDFVSANKPSIYTTDKACVIYSVFTNRINVGYEGGHFFKLTKKELLKSWSPCPSPLELRVRKALSRLNLDIKQQLVIEHAINNKE